MDSALRPRDIQSRIRHGESPESVAQAAQVTVEQLMPFAGPVLNERAHVAGRAQLSSVRRRPSEPGATAARTLGDAVEAQLARLDEVEWDAWQRDDGRWTVEGAFSGDRRSGAARFTYDVPGNYVTVDNDDAQWLVGDLVEEAPRAAAAAPRRRLAAVATPDQAVGSALGSAAEAQLSIDDELGDDALDLVRDDPETGAPTGGHTSGHTGGADPAESTSDHAVGEPAPPRPPASSRRRGRASVPSWDEIMFGGQSD